FLTAAELLRSYVFTGFPWALTSYIWIETPLYQLAAIVGPHGLSFATFLLGALIALGLMRRHVVGLLASAAGLAGALFYGSTLQNAPVAGDNRPSPVVRLIQPNAEQRQKWDPEFIPVFYQRQLALSRAAAPVTPDLVIWPEVAVPFFLNHPAAPLAEISQAANGAPVILGVQRWDGARAFNSLAVIAQGGEIQDVYDKRHLVPFGEYLPASALLGKIGLRALAAQFGTGYSSGTGPRLLDLGELGTVLPLICYEGIFPHEIRNVEARPDWMLLITNDAWFGKFSGPAQHFAQARARTIEMGLPMVRVANTGISAVIDARGRVVDSLPLGVAGSIDVALPKAADATIYWRTGDLPAGLALLFTVFFAWRFRSAVID
ncbi:MAG: apolipoprotein N-acyltransferase, partial [Paracoccaceae bacterium]